MKGDMPANRQLHIQSVRYQQSEKKRKGRKKVKFHIEKQENIY